MTDLVWVISSSALILVIVILRAVFGRRMSAGLRYALWGLVLLKLIIPGTVFSSPVSVKSAVASTKAGSDYLLAESVSSVERSESGEITAVRRAYLPYRIVGNVQEEKELIILLTELTEGYTESLERIRKTLEIKRILDIVWLSGMGAAGIYMLFVNIRFFIKLRKRRVRLDIGAPCRVYFVEGLDSSCLFMNTVYVSKDTAEDGIKLRYVLAHELAHRRHFDAVFALLRSAVLILHWYNPLVWLAAFLSRRDSELFADAGAIKVLGEDERESYGKALIELAARPNARASIVCTATAMTNGKRELKARIRNVARARRTGAVIALVVLAVCLAAAGCVFLGSSDQKVSNTPRENAGPEPTPPEHHMTPDPSEAPLPEDISAHSSTITLPEDRIVYDSEVGTFYISPEGVLFCLEAENKDGIIDGAPLEIFASDGVEFGVFRAGIDFDGEDAPFIIDRDVVKAVTLFYKEEPNAEKHSTRFYHSLVYMKKDGTVWLKGSNPFGMFGSFEKAAEPQKLFDNALGIGTDGYSSLSVVDRQNRLFVWSADLDFPARGEPYYIRDRVSPEHTSGYGPFLTLDGVLWTPAQAASPKDAVTVFNGIEFDLVAYGVRDFAWDGSTWYVIKSDGVLEKYCFDGDYRSWELARDAVSVSCSKYLPFAEKELCVSYVSSRGDFYAAEGGVSDSPSDFVLLSGDAMLGGVGYDSPWCISPDGRLTVFAWDSARWKPSALDGTVTFAFPAAGGKCIYEYAYSSYYCGVGIMERYGTPAMTPTYTFFEPNLFEDPLKWLPPELTDTMPNVGDTWIDVLPGPDHAVLDLDGDGLTDRLWLESGPSNEYTLYISLGSMPEREYYHSVSDVYDITVHALDFDAADKRLDILIDYTTSDGLGCVVGMRVNKGGDGIDVFFIEPSAKLDREAMISLDSFVDASLGIPVLIRSEVFGTNYLSSRLILTADGFRLITPLVWVGGDNELKLLRDMPVTIINDDGSEGDSVTLKEGSTFCPLSTDGRSWVIVGLRDGRRARVDFVLKYGYRLYIEGILQEGYFTEIVYAD